MRWIKRFESFGLGKVLVIDNSKPPEKKYLKNIILYLNDRNIDYLLADDVDKLGRILDSEKISCAISTGSDYRANKDDHSLASMALDMLECPVLGICFGMQTMAMHYGSKVNSGTETTLGEYLLDDIKDHWLFENMDLENTAVSCAFNDNPIDCPAGFEIHAMIDGKIAAMLSDSKKRYGLLFHPEDKKDTFAILDNFIKR